MLIPQEAIAVLKTQRTKTSDPLAEIVADAERTKRMLRRHEPKSLLDIGCGIGLTTIAMADQMPQLEAVYGLDGTGQDPVAAGWQECRGPWNECHLTRLVWDHNRRHDFHLIQIGESPGRRFDLITSFLSCGFHYPLTTYPLADWLTQDGVLAVDVRSWASREQLRGWTVVDCVSVDKKRNHMILKPA